MTELTQFNFRGIGVRTLTDEHGDPWFVAADVAKVLGYRMASDLTRALDDDERGTRPVRTPSGDQEMAVLTEGGLWRAIVQRQTGRMDDDTVRQRVKGFQRWVTTEVLPSIRRTGAYAAVEQITRSDLARMVIESETAKERAEARVAELEPPAQAWQILADAAGDFSLRDAAQILARDHGITTGQNRLMDSLRDWGWVDAKDVPYQRVVDQGLLRQRPRYYEHARTNVRVLAKPQIRITTKGLERVLARVKEAS